MSSNNDNDPSVPPRRGFLRHVAAVTGSIPFAPTLVGGTAAGAALGASAQTAPAAAPAADPVVGYISFSQDEAAFVETLVTIMCPADALTPNGVDCGLAIYIDRQLAGEYGKGARRYQHGPWAEGKPQHGYQLPMTPEQYFKAGVAAANGACAARFGGKPFDQVSPAEADAFLNDLAAGKVSDPRLPLTSWFNDLVYPLFNQACFADPVYGGNYNKVFWKLIGYPGLPATHTIDMVQYRGKPFPGAQDPKSIADFS
ncbi:MAG: gluconate 2-dehydrogenase subunit 3 family protein [Pseudomonadota bacterium]